MSARRTIFGTLASLALVLGFPLTASADTGATVGPARQMVETGQGSAEVYVSNPTDERVRLHVATWASVQGEWERASVGIIPTPRVVTLAPGGQETVNLHIMQQSGAPCQMTGIGFSGKVRESDGVTVVGSTMAQIMLQGRQGSEAACIEVLRDLQPKPVAASNPFPWYLVVLAIALALLLYGGKRWRDRRPPKRREYGFS